MSQRERNFKRLIVDSITGNFLATDGTWTADETEAIHFNDIAAIIRACREHGLEHAEVLMRFQGPRFLDIRLPIRHAASTSVPAQ